MILTFSTKDPKLNKDVFEPNIAYNVGRKPAFERRDQKASESSSVQGGGVCVCGEGVCVCVWWG